MAKGERWKTGLKRVTAYGWWSLPLFVLGSGIGGCGVQLWLLGDAAQGSLLVGVGLAGLTAAAALAAQDASKRDEPEMKAQLKRIEDGVTKTTDDVAELTNRSLAKLNVREKFVVLWTGKWPR